MPDPLTDAIYALNYEPVTQLSTVLNSSPAMALATLLLAALAFLFLKDKRKIVLILATLFLSVAISESTKPIFQVERPCATAPSKVACPSDYAFPSGHAIVAFALMAAMLGESLFPLYLLFALFTAFSRLYLGVHTFPQVAGSLALAFASYAVANAAYQYALKRKWLS